MTKIKSIFKNAGRVMQSRHSVLQPLRGAEMKEVPYLENGFVKVDILGKISDLGTMDNYDAQWEIDEIEVIDLKGHWIWPGWVDSHTHTVFPYYRSDEFEKRLKGKSYQQIAQEGGGILNTAKNLIHYTEDQLFADARQRILKMIAKGTVAIEIKSGYGLNWDGEIKMLKVIKRLKQEMPISIKSTLLAAHALPSEYQGNRKGYIKWITDELLPHCAQEKLIDYVDLFCETGYFDAIDLDAMMTAADQFGIRTKIHTNQFTSIGGIAVSCKKNALSVDHLEVMTEEDIEVLSKSFTMACLLPIAPFFLNDPYPEGRAMLDAGCSVCLATDFNPGSAPSNDMTLAISLACLKCGLLPEEAINAATVNAAFAMEVDKDLGWIAIGKDAHFIKTPPLKGISDIPYRICSEYIEEVIIKGELWRS